MVTDFKSSRNEMVNLAELIQNKWLEADGLGGWFWSMASTLHEGIAAIVALHNGNYQHQASAASCSALKQRKITCNLLSCADI